MIERYLQQQGLCMTVRLCIRCLRLLETVNQKLIGQICSTVLFLIFNNNFKNYRSKKRSGFCANKKSALKSEALFTM